MLTIRPAQLHIFEEPHRRAFVEKAVLLLRTYWPVTCEAVSEAALRLRVMEGILEANQAGFAHSPEILRYLNLTFALGPGFAASEAYPWASRICADRVLRADERMDRLMQKAAFQLEGRRVV